MSDRIYLAIDFGERRIGLAKSDPTGRIASAWKTITYKSLKKALAEIADDIRREKITGILVGYPLAPDGGSSGERCIMIDEFIARLEEITDLPIYTYDERDSSAEARKIIQQHGKKTGKDKEKIDRIAAAIILQRFLDERKD